MPIELLHRSFYAAWVYQPFTAPPHSVKDVDDDAYMYMMGGEL